MKPMKNAPASLLLGTEMSQANEGAMGQRILEATAGIVAAFVGNNQVDSSALPGLIGDVQTSLRAIMSPDHEAHGYLVPAVPIKDSVRPDYLVCLEDGKRVKLLKPYLLRHFGMTPDDYRNRWGLPQSYPMTPPNLSKQRSVSSKMLREHQLEQRRQNDQTAEPPLPREATETHPPQLRMIGQASVATETISAADRQKNLD